MNSIAVLLRHTFLVKAIADAINGYEKTAGFFFHSQIKQWLKLRKSVRIVKDQPK